MGSMERNATVGEGDGMRPIFELHRATVYRGETQVFSAESFTLREGEHVAVLGPNGAGKTTLLMLLTGGVHPVPYEQTWLRVFGQDRWDVWAARRQIGLLSHDLQRDYLRCAEGLRVVLSGFYASTDTYGHQQFGEVQVDRAQAVMKEVGIESLAGRRFGDMSTGEQRRCLLARALVHDPPVLVLDEPTSGLDLKACFQYLDLVRMQIRKGKTVLLATHHLHEIPPEVERLVLLKNGRIVADGNKTELMTGEIIGSLFDCPVTLLCANGWYQAVPNGSAAS